MSEYDRDFWEQRWSQALRAHGDRVAQRPPNAHLTAEVGDLRPGRALDADLATWTPRRDGYDLVVCLYVHVAGSVEEMVRRMATGVARGGTLLLVGHRPIDPATGAATAAAGQVQVSVGAVLAALDPGQWQPIVADERPRPVAGTGVDAVIRVRRRS